MFKILWINLFAGKEKIHGDRQVLLALIPKIRDFLQSNLGLELHSKKIYLQEASKGVRFLGAVVYPYHTLFPQSA